MMENELRAWLCFALVFVGIWAVWVTFEILNRK